MKFFGLLIVLFVLILALGILFLVSQWKVFEKAGKPGWASIIPFYSGWTLAKVGGKPAWWGIIGAFSLSGRTQNSIPLGLEVVIGIVSGVATIFWVLISLGVARNFKKTTSFGFLLAVLPVIGYPILAFGNTKYKFKKKKEKTIREGERGQEK